MMKKIFLTVGILFAFNGWLWAEEQNQKFQGFNLQGYGENGEKTWDVNGDSADIHGSEIKLSNVVANSYGKDKVNVTAQNGTVDQASGNMLLQKDVVVTSDSGAQLLTDSLDWNRQKDTVTTQDGVIITHEGLTATGKGMEARPGLKSAQINKDVTVRVDPSAYKSDSKTITVTSDGPMVIDEANSMASFEENVVAVSEDRILKADKMEIYFDAKAKTIKQMVCTGHVEITQGENKSYADKAVYHADEKRVVLSGRPKLIMLTEGNNVFSAFGNKKPGKGL